MKATFVKQDGKTLKADFSEKAIKESRKDAWLKDMLKFYSDKGIEKEELEKKLSDVYDAVKGKKAAKAE